MQFIDSMQLFLISVIALNVAYGGYNNTTAECTTRHSNGRYKRHQNMRL